MNIQWRFWIDRGGTFTDVVAQHGDDPVISIKLLSDNDAYQDAALEGIRRVLNIPIGEPLPSGEIASVRMGTTVATNALLERKGTPTILVTTRGFADAATIAYQNRPQIFARAIELSNPLHADVIEATERLNEQGEVVISLDEMNIRIALENAYAKGFKNVAVALLHSIRNSDHETRIGEIARAIGFQHISLSHETSPLMKLIPRIDTAVADAYLSSGLGAHIDRIDRKLPNTRLSFMRSSGGLSPAESFSGKDAILSGPAGGIVAMARTAQAAGIEHVIGFDMGGTSTDVSRFDGEFERTFETKIAGIRIRTPMLRIHTVAAGGGSILHFDGHRYRVGPDSAGAVPGPTSYRQDGPLTVTDANVMLGRIPVDYFPSVFGENNDQPLDFEAVKHKFETLTRQIKDGRDAQQVAEGFIHIAVSNMADAIKRISVQEGRDASQYTLACFGGAGGQHACAVADQLRMKQVLVHPLAGVLSAYGMGLAQVTATGEQAIEEPLRNDIVDRLYREAETLIGTAKTELADEDGPLTTVTKVLLKYMGTDTSIPIELTDANTMRSDFEAQYAERFSFLMPDRDLVAEAVTVEVKAGRGEVSEEKSPADPRTPVPRDHIDAHFKQQMQVPLYDRDDLPVSAIVDGPAIIVEPGATTVIDPGWRATVTELKHLLLERMEPIKSSSISTDADPVMLELFNNMFMSIAEQMGHRLQGSANSVNIKERVDFSCALFDEKGNLIANAPHIPVHLGSMSDSIKAVVAAQRATMRAGDSYILNNPYAGGTHLPDITVITPVFDRDEASILFYVASRGHHADIGGTTPGSMPPHSKHIREEGVIFNGELLARDKRLLETETMELLTGADNPARNPVNNIADLQAQLAANETGSQQLRALVDQYGLDVVTAYMGHVRTNAEAAVRAVIDSLSDGHFRYTTDRGAVIEVTVTIDKLKRSAHIDFTGTSNSTDDNFNAPSSIVTAAVLYVFRTLIGDDIPLNGGCLEPIDITIPKDSLLSPSYPRAVVAGNVETSQAVVAALYGALGIQAEGAGTMNNVTFGNSRYQYYETVASGSGAGDGFDGTDVVQTHMTNSLLTDPEVLEWRYPVTVERFEIRHGSGGDGKWRGGDGASRALRFNQEMTLSLLSSNRKHAPYGAAGGMDGTVGKQWIERTDGSITQLAGCDTTTVHKGDVFVIETPGGGGYGSSEPTTSA